MTSRKTLNDRAPSTRAASTSSCGTDWRLARKVTTMNGVSFQAFMAINVGRAVEGEPSQSIGLLIILKSIKRTLTIPQLGSSNHKRSDVATHGVAQGSTTKLRQTERPHMRPVQKETNAQPKDPTAAVEPMEKTRVLGAVRKRGPKAGPVKRVA